MRGHNITCYNLSSQSAHFVLSHVIVQPIETQEGTKMDLSSYTYYTKRLEFKLINSTLESV